jgi:hypothetical protein
MRYCTKNKGDTKMKYEAPTIITYTEEEVQAIIGPAQTAGSWWEEELG